ncbi:MAG: putative cytochrome c oxidase subunit [Ilumatobacteraceae bacterium]|nr:putative cytochrome c oxidase subunit [Ilumatobacteraceae bacterium]
MTTIDTHATGAVGTAGDPAATAGTSSGLAQSGIAGWVTTVDHKRIGRMFFGVGLLAALGAAVLGILLGIDRASSSSVLGADSVPQVFAAYQVGLIFIVLLPVLLGLAVAIVPLQLGARALALPRFAAAGFWAWLIGSALVIGTIAANGGPGGGDRRMVAGYLLAQVVLLVGLLAAAISLVASVLSTRAPGMNMRRVPPFSFAALIGALALILALPVLIGALLYSFVDYRYGGTGFGSSADLMSHIGFGFTQPLTFAFAVPAFGIAIEALAVASGKRLPMRGTIFAGFGLIGLGLFGGVIQVPASIRKNIADASFGTALGDIVPYALVNLLPILGALIVLGVGGMALSKGRPRLVAPLVFGLLGALMVFVGMLANAVYQIGDAQLGGTVFEEGTRLFVAYGALLAALGGIAYWGPKLWGRTIADMALVPLALLGFIGTVLAGGPLLIAGFAKQPADAVDFDYSGPKALWNVLSLAGHALVALTVLAFVGLAVKAFTKGSPAGDDPWDGQTLEWATSSPAPLVNFAELHTVTSPEPLLDLKHNAERSV